jgi:inositol 1,4,5-triphosphate receptor type 1
MILLLNLIFGIIIDAFADMRDYQNQLEIDVKERCFICGLNRIEFETKNKSWIEHIQREHNAFAYLYFILYVQDKPGNECNGVEKYVKALILKEDPIFFPVGKCLSIASSSGSHNMNSHN